MSKWIFIPSCIHTSVVHYSTYNLHFLLSYLVQVSKYAHYVWPEVNATAYCRQHCRRCPAVAQQWQPSQFSCMNALKMSEKCTLGHIFQGTMNYLCDMAKVALLLLLLLPTIEQYQSVSCLNQEYKHNTQTLLPKNIS